MKTRNPILWIVPGIAFGLVAGFVISSRMDTIQAEVLTPTIVAPKELTSYRDLVKRVAPAVVSIESLGGKNRRTGRDDSPIGFGSGVIVDSKGTILTNFHVIENADSVNVILPDGRRFASKTIFGDRKTDLAIVRISVDKPLPYLEFGNSDEIEVGDRVLAIGAPYGLSGTVTHGIISARNRNIKLNQYEDFLQTDAAINPGNSGGPLISMDGRVIGINSVIKSKSGGNSGIGLAISSNLARSVMEQLQKDGSVRRGYLGVGIADLDDVIAEKLGVDKGTQGVVLTRVYPAAPAFRSGLKVGDVITSVGGKKVRDGSDLQKTVSGLPLNLATPVGVFRDGRNIEVEVKIEEQPEEFGSTPRTVPADE